MAAWMTLSQHNWASTLETCGALFVPAIVPVPLPWPPSPPGPCPRSCMSWMLPLMLVAKLRRPNQDTS